MLESFRLTTLSMILDSKSRLSGLAAGWGALSNNLAVKKTEARLNERFLAKSAVQSLLAELYGKYRVKILSGIYDLKFGKKALEKRQEQIKKAAFMAWNRWYMNIAGGALSILIRHKNAINKKLKNLFLALFEAVDAQKRNCLNALINNKDRITVESAVNGPNMDVTKRFVDSLKARLAKNAQKPAYKNMDFDLGQEQAINRGLVEAIPDFQEIQNDHKKEILNLRQNANMAALFRKMIFGNLSKLKWAYDKLTKKPEKEEIMDPSLAQRWLFNTLDLKYNIKKLEALQVLRFPTFKRHEKQKSAEILKNVSQQNLKQKLQVAFNRILQKSPKFERRVEPLGDVLQNYLDKQRQLALYSLFIGKNNAAPIVSAPQLKAIQGLTNLVLAQQVGYDQNLLRSCFVKLGTMLDPETSNGNKYHQQNYTFDLAMEKRLKLEESAHPKILSKINAKAEAARLRLKIETKKRENEVLEANLRNTRESTRKLTLARESEVRELVSRKNLGFCYENELKRILGDLWGPAKHGQKSEQNSLSHLNSNMNEIGDHSNKTGLFEQSISKNVDLEESSPNILLEHFRGGPADFQSTDVLRSGAPLKLNHSEKMVKDMESKRLVRRLKELNFDSLVESQSFGMEEILGQLSAAKTELESGLERLVADYNNLQTILANETAKAEQIQNKLEDTKRKKVKFEMTLIDYQDKKGILGLEKTTIGHRNDQIRSELESIQNEIGAFKDRSSLSQSESQELERLKTEYFEKHELIQSNSGNILRIDQELLEVSKAISNMSGQGSDLNGNIQTLEESNARLQSQVREDSERLSDIRDEIRDTVGQIASNASLIESLEMKKRGISSSTLENAGSGPGIQTLGKFKEGYLKLNELKVQNVKMITAQNDLLKEKAEGQALFDDLTQKIEETDRASTDKLAGLNIQRKQLAANQEQIAQKLNALSKERAEVKRSIETETEKIKEFLTDGEELERKASESQVSDNRNDFMSKNSAFLSTKADFMTTDVFENSTVRENVLNLSKSSLADENVKTILVSKLNPEVKEVLGINEQLPLGNPAFDEVLAFVIQRKKAYLQNNQLTFFSFLKKEEIDDRIKGNSCEILDIKEKLTANEISIKNCRKRLRDVATKTYDAEQAMRLAKSKHRVVYGAGAPVVYATTTTQTVIDETHFNLTFKADKIDEIVPKKRGVGFDLHTILDASICPKLRSRAIQKLEPLIQKKKSPGLNYLDIEEKDIFDGRNNELVGANEIKFDLNESGIRDSLILDEYFPSEGVNKRSIRRLNLRRQSLNYTAPTSAESYQALHDLVRKSCMVETLVRPLPKKVIQVSALPGIFNFRPPVVEEIVKVACGNDPVEPERMSLGIHPMELERASFGADPMELIRHSLGNDPVEPERKSFGNEPRDGERVSFGIDPMELIRHSLGNDPVEPERKSFGNEPRDGERASLGTDPIEAEKLSCGNDPVEAERISFGIDPVEAEKLSCGNDPVEPEKVSFGVDPADPEKVELGVDPLEVINVSFGVDPLEIPTESRGADPMEVIIPPKTIVPVAPILTNEHFESAKTRSANRLAKVVPRAIKNAANLNFYHLKLVTSNTKLQNVMTALKQFRVSHLKDQIGTLQNKLTNRNAQALLDSVHSVEMRQKRQGFQRIRAKLNEINRYKNWLLSKWMTRGDTNMRKHLRLVVQYWKHIRNDNLWNNKILKTMAIKAPLIPQIALWRLMLFKKRDYTCQPRHVKGLLSLITVVDSKHLMKGLRAIQGRKRPKNDFDAVMVPEKVKYVDPGLLQSELIEKKEVDEDFGVRYQRLYSLFTYMGIIQKRNMLNIFYKFMEQVKAEPVHTKILRFEPKALEPADDLDSEIRAVKFLLDQQSKSKVELTAKTTQIQDLKDELSEKSENLYFMQVFLLNLALRRTDRVMRRIYSRNAELAGFQLMEALKSKV
jgi:hypothetical protein